MNEREPQSLAKTARVLYEYMKSKNTDTIHFTLNDCFGDKGVTVVLSVYDQKEPNHLQVDKTNGGSLIKAKEFNFKNEDWEESE